MATIRIYQPVELSPNTNIQLNQQASHHLIRVLRYKKGSRFILFNGDGSEYSACIEDESQKKCIVSIDAQSNCNNESPLNITLLQGLSRNDRMDHCIQKSTELGVSRIIPYTSQRTSPHANNSRSNKKHEHWQRVCISASEQSGRCIVPVIEQTKDYKSVIKASKNSTRLLLDPLSNNTLRELNNIEGEICILVGPESGLTQEEIELAHQKNFIGVRFGRRILRTETAGPAVISGLQTLWGDLG